jgi:oligopeptidase A
MPNPLLQKSILPLFSAIKAEHVEPAVDEILSVNRNSLKSLLAKFADQQPDWNSLIKPLEMLDNNLSRVWSPVRHLNSVMNSKELRAAHDACVGKLSAYSTELSQNEDLYKAYLHLQQSEAFKQYSQAQKKTIENALLTFRLSGVALDQNKKQQFKDIKQKLSLLKSSFEHNVLDATRAWKKQLTTEQQLSGLPEYARAMAKQTAETEKMEGWVFTLDAPSYIAVMTYADDRALRQEMYTAYSTRASDQGPNGGEFDNSQIMEDILKCRDKLAELLGYNNYAEYSIANKMAESTDAVLQFLDDLVTRARPQAQKELDELKQFARQLSGLFEFQAWDLAYYSEKLKQKNYGFSQEEVKPYFPAPKVINGLFAIVNRLYGINIREVAGVDVWHPDVKFYEIRDAQNNLRGQFYFDLYARVNKRGGAWMDECVNRMKLDDKIQTPVAYLTCNMTPPVGKDPALLTHDEVTTLFHEFGHGLHHMLTQVEARFVSGINGVEWDAVELPSQFMENWCWEKEGLDLIASHYQTSEALPEALYKKMQAAKNFQSAMVMIRQLEFSLFDFKLHMLYGRAPFKGIQPLLDEVRSQVSVVIPPAFNRFQHGFTHIFAGGYAAGYYSYKWAEVLSADAFSKFEEEGIFNRKTGEAFLHNILEQGGSQKAMDLFKAFRGREPKIDALLHHNGLA